MMPPCSPDSAPERTLRFSIIVPTFRRRWRLERLVESILRLDYPAETFEAIIVNDGSTDDTAAYLASLGGDLPLCVLGIANSGPAVARNRGARVARGEIFVFVDDDCVVPPDWLRRIDGVLRAGGLDAVGGEVRNALPQNPYAAAYEENHRFFVEALNRPGRAAPFLTTNNFACRGGVFRELGGYDERFHVGGEDREFVARLIAAGYVVHYEPSVFVDHYHDFTLRAFVQQYYRFGKGAYLLHTVAGKEKRMPTAALTLAGYGRLLMAVGRGRRIDRRFGLVVLTILAQSSAALGYIATSWEGLRDLTGEKRRIHSPQQLGIQGRVRELLSYLLGTGLSSALGLLAFFMLGRALSIEEYGVFTFAFSLSTFIQTLGSVGPASAITRHAVELMKTGEDAGRRTMLMSAVALFAIVLALLIAGMVLGWGPLLSYVHLPWGGGVLPLLLAGTIGATALEFFASAYQIGFRLLRLTLVRFAVALIRILAIGTLLLLGIRDPLYLYAGFFGPAWLGAGVAAAQYVRLGLGGGGIRWHTVSRLASYAGWQTLSSATIILLQHAGTLILALTAGEEQAGLYGLGMTFSFIYGVVGSALGSYYLPIATRLRSHDDVREFLRRTNRLNLPVMLAGVLSLLLAPPLFEWIFGASKAGAIPVLLLLSLAAIVGIGTVAILSLFHYFLQPRSIAVAQASSIGAFGLSALLLADFGAAGMATAYLASRVMLYLVLQILIRREFAQRGILA